MKGQHLAAVQAHLQSLTALYPEIDEDQDQMLVRLAMLLHGEDPTDMSRADELLNGNGAAYVAYAAPIIDLNAQTPDAQPSPDGAERIVTLPVSNREITIKPLTGRQWRLGLTDAQRLPRTAVMSGLTIEECGQLSLLDYLTVEKACVPFLSDIWKALTSGGDSALSSGETDSASET